MTRAIWSLLAVMVCLSCSRNPPPARAAAEAPEAGDHSTAEHGNHDPRHGGLVYMKGDLHFEVVLSRTGTHRVYFSDAMRAELPAATVSDLTLTLLNGEETGEPLRGRIDESGESWVVAGAPFDPPGEDGAISARLAFVLQDEPYWIDVPYLESLDRGDAP